MVEGPVVAGVAVLPLFWYALVMGITPGPNNLMLAASGMNFGLRRSLPHILGVLLGFTALATGAALGLGAIYLAAPDLQRLSRYLGAAFLLYFAWRISQAGRAEAAVPRAPFRFHEAALFQVINPKGWLYAISSASAFLSSEGLPAVAVLTATAALVTVISTLTWTCFGTVLARFITSPQRRKAMNWRFAASLLALIPLIVGDPT